MGFTYKYDTTQMFGCQGDETTSLILLCDIENCPVSSLKCYYVVCSLM